jgi:8-oxo-dGTP pyrophosphatase MutT (NUDIX family)
VHRRNTLSKLDSYAQRFPGESKTTSRMIEFINGHSDCFERELPIGHMTGSAWLLDEGLDRALLTHHRKLNRWLQPGGHADGQSDITAVCLREAKEESGLSEIELVSDALLDIDIHLIPARGSEPEHYHYDCRLLLRCLGDDAYVVSEESHDLAWIRLSDIPVYTDEESINRMVDKTLRFKAGDLKL